MEYANIERDIYDNQVLAGLLAESFKYEPSLMNPIIE